MVGFSPLSYLPAQGAQVSPLASQGSDSSSSGGASSACGTSNANSSSPFSGASGNGPDPAALNAQAFQSDQTTSSGGSGGLGDSSNMLMSMMMLMMMTLMMALMGGKGGGLSSLMGGGTGGSGGSGGSGGTGGSGGSGGTQSVGANNGGGSGSIQATPFMQRLANAGRNAAQSMGGFQSQSLCATGVSKALSTMGISVHGNGNEIDNNLPKDKFKQVNIPLEEALKIPGLVLTWESTSSAAGSKYGHTAITLGDGHSSASDFIERNTTNNGRTGLKIFMPVS